MSYQTHDLAEWAAVLSLGTGITASAFVPWLLLVDSVSACDFDPRPLLGRAGDRLLVETVRAKGTARDARDRARLAVAAALLALALRLNAPASAPKGATHA